MKPLLLLPVLLLCGCSSAPQSYATRLKLPPLEAPAVLAPVPSTPSGDMATLISSIERAQTPSQADAVVSQSRQAVAMLGAFGNGFSPSDTPELTKKKTTRQAEVNRMLANVEQAAQIKRAQLENGDAEDATGEVAERLKAARQSSANCDLMNQSIPQTTFGQ